MTSTPVTPELDDLAGGSPDELADQLVRALEGRELLTHPFYRRWEAGSLAAGELSEYAVHYRAFEQVLPVVLSAVVKQLQDDGEVEAAAMVERNLADELGRPEPHLTQFDRLAAALPTPVVATEPGPAAEALVDTYLGLVAEGPVAALAGLAAYETQAAAIAATKADGLRRWYGLDDTATEFWDVHEAMDTEHGEWAVEALFLLGADPAEVYDSARRAADGWWELLDEREDEAALV
jgi:pyrroloquinoline quinone (PQQ) biosynthesis protein C